MKHVLHLTCSQILAITKLLTPSGREDAEMDQPSPDEGAPKQQRPERRQQDRLRPEPIPHVAHPRPISLAHPVVVGYNGSASAANALAYAAGMARRLGR